MILAPQQFPIRDLPKRKSEHEAPTSKTRVPDGGGKLVKGTTPCRLYKAKPNRKPSDPESRRKYERESDRRQPQRVKLAKQISSYRTPIREFWLEIAKIKEPKAADQIVPNRKKRREMENWESELKVAAFLPFFPGPRPRPRSPFRGGRWRLTSHNKLEGAINGGRRSPPSSSHSEASLYERRKRNTLIMV